MRWAQPRPLGSMPAANGGILRHPGWGGSQAYEGHDQRTKARIYSFLPSFHHSPLLPPSTGLFLHFLCFSCLLGHPDADMHTKSEPSNEAIPVPPAL